MRRSPSLGPRPVGRSAASRRRRLRSGGSPRPNPAPTERGRGVRKKPRPTEDVRRPPGVETAARGEVTPAGWTAEPVRSWAGGDRGRRSAVALALAVAAWPVSPGGSRGPSTAAGSRRPGRGAARGRGGPLRRRPGGSLAALAAPAGPTPRSPTWLGICEHAAGHYDAALAAWARVPPGSPCAAAAALARARTLVGDLGRFADAEPILEAALRAPGPARLEVRHTLGAALFHRAAPRGDAPLIRRRLARVGATRPSELRDLWLIDDATVQVEPVRAVVDDAAARPPTTTASGSAGPNLAPRTGRLDEAAPLARRLRGPTARRPGRLARPARLGPRRGRPGRGRARRSPTSRPTLSARPSASTLRAWLAAQRGRRRRPSARRWSGRIDDRPGRRRRRWSGWPCSPPRRARPRRAAELRRRKAELDRAKDRYRRLLGRVGPGRGLAELAGLAEALGRRFEADGWWALAARRDPGDADGPRRPRPARGRTAPGSAAAARRARSPTASADGRLGRGRPVAPRPSARRGRRPELRRRRRGRRPPLHLRQRPDAAPPAPRDDGRRRRPARLRRRRLARRLRRPGRPVPARPGRPRHRRPPVPQPGRRHVRGRRPSGRASPRCRGGYGHGVAVGDYDNDGHPDLFVTRWRSYALYRNRGDGTFEDVTDRAGPGRRPRLADLGGLRRPRQRRRPRPLRLPLPRLGRRRTPALCRDPDDAERHTYCNPRDVRRRCPTTSSATTAAGSST